MPPVRGLIWPILVSIFLPLTVAWFVYPDKHLPPGFGLFPPEFIAEMPGFSPLVFTVILLVEVVVALCLLFPRRFGFGKVAPAPKPAPGRLPPWFWIGTLLMGSSWVSMWARATPWSYYAFTPLWWGFILALDGWVYRRNAGRSLLSIRPRTLFASAVVSVAGWFFFEYYNYFALGNWYYPNSHIEAVGHNWTIMLFLIAYSTVWPAIFEWYTLLNTYPRLVARYVQGPKLALPGEALFWGGFTLVVAMVRWPHPFFLVLWFGPLCILSGLLIRKGVWTPFTAIAQGNWSPLIMVALASLITGFFWELWNYGSAHPDPLLKTNLNYWVYNIPYVNVLHGLSEMPVVGYAGYLPFGIVVWLSFTWTGLVFRFDTSLDLGYGTTKSLHLNDHTGGVTIINRR